MIINNNQGKSPGITGNRKLSGGISGYKKEMEILKGPQIGTEQFISSGGNDGGDDIFKLGRKFKVDFPGIDKMPQEIDISFPYPEVDFPSSDEIKFPYPKEIKMPGGDEIKFPYPEEIKMPGGDEINLPYPKSIPKKEIILPGPDKGITGDMPLTLSNLTDTQWGISIINNQNAAVHSGTGSLGAIAMEYSIKAEEAGKTGNIGKLLTVENGMKEANMTALAQTGAGHMGMIAINELK